MLDLRIKKHRGEVVLLLSFKLLIVFILCDHSSVRLRSCRRYNLFDCVDLQLRYSMKRVNANSGSFNGNSMFCCCETVAK